MLYLFIDITPHRQHCDLCNHLLLIIALQRVHELFNPIEDVRVSFPLSLLGNKIEKGVFQVVVDVQRDGT